MVITVNNKKFDLQGIGIRIRTERERMKLTREQFAEAVSISPLYLGQIERGQRSMSLKTFIRIAASLHASTDYLIYGISENSSLIYGVNENKEMLYGISLKEDSEKSGILELIKKCNNRELKLAEEVLKLLVTYVK